MALQIEKSLFDVRSFLLSALQAQVTAVNSEIIDSVTIVMPKDIEVARFDILTNGVRYPRLNIIHDPSGMDFEAMTLGADECTEKIVIIVGEKDFKDENASLKCDRIADAIRRAFVADSTANNAVEFITVTKVRPYPPAAGIAVCEVVCKIQRQVTR